MDGGIYRHPEIASALPMSKPQIELLRRVVATNGGGINARGENRRTVQGLLDRHMIQGKRGDLGSIVHTHIGLAWCRANPPK